MYFDWERGYQLSTYAIGGGLGSSKTEVEALSLEHRMVYLRLSDPSYELDRTISHSNLTKHKHWNEEKILRKFRNKYFK